MKLQIIIINFIAKISINREDDPLSVRSFFIHMCGYTELSYPHW